MVCDQRITIRIDWKNVNPERARKALTELGLSPRYFNEQTGQVTLSISTYSDDTQDSMMQKLNAKYAQLTIQDAATQYGWNIESEFTTEKGERVFEVARY